MEGKNSALEPKKYGYLDPYHKIDPNLFDSFGRNLSLDPSYETDQDSGIVLEVETHFIATQDRFIYIFAVILEDCCCCCVVVLHPWETATVILGLSVNLTTLFLGRLRPPKGLTSTLCTHFR